jgi:hypothetical protein
LVLLRSHADEAAAKSDARGGGLDHGLLIDDRPGVGLPPVGQSPLRPMLPSVWLCCEHLHDAGAGREGLADRALRSADAFAFYH